MKLSYKLLVDRFEYKAGTIVYEYNGYDYGLARDDIIVTGVYHVNMTTDPSGGTPFFTVPLDDVEQL